MNNAMKAFGLCLLTATMAVAAEETWTSLCDGKSLDGWVQRGGKAEYRVENGEIIGKSVANTPNSFLCTAKEYGNFVLEYEYKVDPRLNSGVQIRSHCFDKETEFTNGGKTQKIAAGRVHGYQVEIDNDPVKKRFWAAGLYEEGRRGWLYPGISGGEAKAFTEQGAKVTKVDDWNKVRVECRGASIKTWLNGELRAEVKDEVTPTGFIALQVHSVSKEHVGLENRWRNVRIQDLKD
jgi:hypothetical protein